jgi:hypothetical protein
MAIVPRFWSGGEKNVQRCGTILNLGQWSIQFTQDYRRDTIFLGFNPTTEGSDSNFHQEWDEVVNPNPASTASNKRNRTDLNSRMTI